MVQTQQTVYSKHVQFFVYPLYLSKSVQKFSIGPTQTAAAAAKLLQSCLTLCNPIDGSPPASSVPGILQARVLEWVAISFSNSHRLLIHKHFAYFPCISFFLPKCHRLSRDQGSGGPWHAQHDPCSMIFFKFLDKFSKVQKHLCYLIYFIRRALVQLGLVQ